MTRNAVLAMIIGLVLTIVMGIGGCEHTQEVLRPVLEGRADDTLYSLDPEGEPVVYLTIDDGPSPMTDDILDILEDHDATATLFLHTGEISSRRVLERAINAGHNLGHHMPEDRDWSTATAETFAAAFMASHCLLAVFGEGYTGLFRPPRGSIDRDVMLPALTRAGMEGSRAFVMASYVPWDAAGATEFGWATGERLMARRYGEGLGNAVEPGDIVVFHDGPRRRRTVNTRRSLKVFLEILERRGLEAKALPARGYDASACERPR